MGRANRKAANAPSSLRQALDATGQANDSLSLDQYAEYGVLGEALYLPEGSQYSDDEFSQASQAVSEVQKACRARELEEIRLDKKGLRLAEGIFTELGDSVGDGEEISEQFDPDGEFLSQTDSDHMYSLAAYMRALREGQPVRGYGSGISDARREAYAGLVDNARALAKEA